jgi:hypothetical protein
MVYKTSIVKSACCDTQIKFTVDENNKVSIACDNCDCSIGELNLPKLIVNMLIDKSTEY